MYAVVYNWGFVWTCAVVMFIFLNYICLFSMYVCFLGVQMEGRQQLRVSFLLITINVLGTELRLSSVVASTLPAGRLGRPLAGVSVVGLLWECEGQNQRLCTH